MNVPALMKNRWTQILSLALLASGLTIPLAGCKATKSELAAKLISQLRQERFAELYDESSDMLHSNVAKGEFIQRMKIAVTKLKAIDENLNFERDWNFEKGLIGSRDESLLVTSVHRLKKGDKDVVVVFYWEDDTEKFFDFGVLPYPGTSEGCAVHGVAYQTTSRSPTLDDPCP